MILAIRHGQSGVRQVWANIQTGGAPASSKTPSSRMDDPGMAREDWMCSWFMQDAPDGKIQRCRQFIRSAPALPIRRAPWNAAIGRMVDLHPPNYVVGQFP